MRARGANRPLLPLLVPNVAAKSAQECCVAPNPEKQRKRGPVNPFASIKLLRSPGNAFTMTAFGVGYATYSCLQASLSSLFLDIYNISGLASGLIYIPFGVACALSAFATGKLLDRNFRKTANELGVPVTRNKADNLSTFPVEKARLRTIVPLISLSACLMIAYGWQLKAGVVMAGPLVTQFFVGLTIQTMFTALSTLLVDVNQECPSTAQAACNLVRCEMAAGYLAALDPLLRAIGSGWTFSLLAAIVLFSAIILLALQWKGLHWRQKGVDAKAAQGTNKTAVAVDGQRESDAPQVDNKPVEMQIGRDSELS